jgi:hypothetical protein
MDPTKVSIFSNFCKNVKNGDQICIMVKSEAVKLKIIFILFEMKELVLVKSLLVDKNIVIVVMAFNVSIVLLDQGFIVTVTYSNRILVIDCDSKINQSQTDDHFAEKQFYVGLVFI